MCIASSFDVYSVKTLTSGLASFWPLPNSLTSNTLLSSSYRFSSCKKISIKDCFITFGIGHNMYSSINQFYSSMVKKKKTFKKLWGKIKHLSKSRYLEFIWAQNLFPSPLVLELGQREPCVEQTSKSLATEHSLGNTSSDHHNQEFTEHILLISTCPVLRTLFGWVGVCVHTRLCTRVRARKNLWFSVGNLLKMSA